MNSTKMTRRALLTSVVAMFLCITMLIGTTFAWFTDTASTAVNKIQAGKLDVALEMKTGTDAQGNDIWENAEGKTLQFKVNGQIPAEGTQILWEPGCTYELPELRIVNKGNLALKYKIQITGIQGDAELNNAIEWTITNTSATTALDAKHSLAAGASDTLTIKGHMKEDAGNQYQGLSIDGIGITVVATQDTVENDSFNNQYDAGAPLDVEYGAEILESLNDPEVTEVVAGENIDMSDSTFQTNNYGNAQFNIPDGKTLNLNYNSIVRPDGGSGSGFKFSNGVTSTVTNGYVINEGDMTAIDIEYGANATFENVKFEGHGDSMIRVRANGEGEKVTAIFKNCTFTNAGVEIKGMNGASEVDIQFINCTFTGSYYMYDAEGNKLTDKHGHVHYTSYLFNAESYDLYGNISFDNCTFDYDAHEASYKQNVIELYGCYQGSFPGKILNVTLNNVTINAQKAVPVSIDSRYVSGLNLVETGTNSYTMDGASVNYKGQ